MRDNNNKEGVLFSIGLVKRIYVLVYITLIRFKITRVVHVSNHAFIGGRCDVILPGWDTNVWRG